jgi:hypothetical protein
MTTERKAFQPLPGKENPQFLEDGKRIYQEMRKKYPNDTTEDLDNILNGLCASLTCLFVAHVGKDNRKNFIHLIYKILMDNVD